MWRRRIEQKRRVCRTFVNLDEVGDKQMAEECIAEDVESFEFFLLSEESTHFHSHNNRKILAAGRM